MPCKIKPPFFRHDKNEKQKAQRIGKQYHGKDNL